MSTFNNYICPIYTDNGPIAINTDLVEYTMDQETALLHRQKPIRIDFGMNFIDQMGRRHSQACGFLSIYGAMMFYSARMTMHPSLAIDLSFGRFTPEKLKELCGRSGDDWLNYRISDADMQLICETFGIKIVVHGSLYVDTFAPNVTERITIHLWYAHAHYMVYPQEYSEFTICDFTQHYADLNCRMVKVSPDLAITSRLVSEERERAEAEHRRLEQLAEDERIAAQLMAEEDARNQQILQDMEFARRLGEMEI